MLLAMIKLLLQLQVPQLLRWLLLVMAVVHVSKV